MLVGATQMLLQTGAGLGLERAQLLDAAGLREADLADRDAYLPFARHVALGQAIIGARPGVNIGVAALQHLSPGDFGVLGYVITHARCLREALDAFVRFQRLLSDGIRWRVEIGSHCSVFVEADPAFEQLGYPIEALVGVWLTLGRMITGQVWSPLSVAFRHAPLGDPLELERHFGVHVSFRAEHNELCLDLETLALPIATGRPVLMPSLRLMAEERLSEVDGHGSVTSALRARLFECVPQQTSAKEELARALGMSARTLNRRLQDEGTTFREVLEDVRKELAQAWLSDGRHAVYEIAFVLGYSEPSTFHRSFRRWTGSSPHVWRRERARQR